MIVEIVANVVNTLIMLLIGACMVALGYGVVVKVTSSEDVERIADDTVAPTFVRVASHLRLKGHAKVTSEIVPVYSIKLRGSNGMTVAGVVIINADAPQACFRKILAHEATHALLGRDEGMTPDQSEKLAVEMETIISPKYQPNC